MHDIYSPASVLRPTGAAPPAIAGFRVERELGWSTFGHIVRAVWLVINVARNRPEALTLLWSTDRKMFDPPRQEEFCNRMWEMNRRLRHPHIAAIHAVNRDGDACWFTTEYVEGHFPCRPFRDPRAAARTALTLAGALWHAHRHGVLHGDIKPGNILMDGEGGIKLVGFWKGALLAVLGPREAGLLGTSPYAAPELQAGRIRRLGPPTDVFSFGVWLSEMLRGDETDQAGDSASLLDVCQRCTQQDPDNRYPGFRAVISDLERFLEPTAPQPFRVIVALHRGDLRPGAARDRLEHQTLSDPRLRHHLESLETFDLERFAVEQDVRSLRDFATSEAHPICREVARSQGEMLRAHLQTDSAPVGELGASEWQSHVEECAYCRLMQRLVQARLTAEELELPEEELLLRDRLLEPLYGDELDRASWKLLAGSRRIEDPSEQTDVVGTRTRLDPKALLDSAVEPPEAPAGSLVGSLGAALKARGDSEEFNSRIADLYRALRPFVARRVKVWKLPEEIAEDLTVEALQRLLERIRASEPLPTAAELLPWLKAQIRNRALEYHRSGGAREERIALLQSALEELKPRLAEIEWQMLVDRFLHARSLPEIAATHGLPLGSVVIAMQRILRRVVKEVRVKRE